MNRRKFVIDASLLSALAVAAPARLLSKSEAADLPSGFTPLFNGKDLSGWVPVGHLDPRKLAAMSPEEKKAFYAKGQPELEAHWRIENGELINDGDGPYATTEKNYRDFEFAIDYKTYAKVDRGIYLKGNPQVQIWDFTEKDEQSLKLGKQFGSGGLWNNAAGTPGRDPSEVADNPLGQWNRFLIRQIGARTWVWLNGKLVVDNVIMENFYDRKAPLFVDGPIQLQTHSPKGDIHYRNIGIREIPAEEANALLRGVKDPEGFKSLFAGTSLDAWTGAVDNYEVRDGAISCKPGKGGVLHTKDKYGDFVARVEFLLPPAGNNGLAIRYPGTGDPAYAGATELQILDDGHEKYAKLDARQSHGSAYGMVPAYRGFLRPVGEWNYQEVTVQGPKIKVELNGSVILNADLSTVKEFMAESAHPGKDLTEGYFGFAGHGDAVKFRNVAIKPL